jgi:hypothetical protein
MPLKISRKKHRTRSLKLRHKSKRYRKRGGTKTARSIRDATTVKTNAKKTTRTFVDSIAQRHGSKGSDLRQQLVNFCRAGDVEGYEKLTNKIIEDYYKDGDKSIFFHLKNNYFKNETENVNGFRIPTRLCLFHFLHRAQEEAIPESMIFLADISELRNRLGVTGMDVTWHREYDNMII